MFDLDPTACYRALQTRDERFDGRLFVGVRSTGVYCRPICPAGTPLPRNCRFFGSAAAAAEAGFRPCLRCRPETAPDTGPWRGTSTTVTRGLALIADGALDGPEASVEALADRLGVGERQLRRLFREHVGASPIAVAQNRRVHFAKQLIHETRLPMTEIAFAAGFGSVRRFNELFQELFGRPPSALRRSRGDEVPAAHGVSVRLAYRPPYDWAAIRSFFAERALDGVERVEEGYARTLLVDGAPGSVSIRHRPGHLEATIRVAGVRRLAPVVAQVRRAFDLRADVEAIEAHLARDPLLAPRIAARPGLRVPGGWSGFEVGVRAILGQQISIGAARALCVTLVGLCGSRIPEEARLHPELDRCFPTPEQLIAADLDPLRMPGARKRALVALAQAALDDPELFSAAATVEATQERLCRIPGIGPWSAAYIALRAAREPDAFPASDAGLLRAAATGTTRPTPAELLARSEAWRPWRAYAAQHLWSTP